MRGIVWGLCMGYKWQDVIGTVNAIPVGRVLKIFFIFFFFTLTPFIFFSQIGPCR